MEYILEFVKGVLLAFGIIAGFMMAIIMLLSRTDKDDQYEAESLYEPFKTYLRQINKEERYEEIEKIKAILAELKKGVVPEDVNSYKIKKDSALHLNDEDGKTALRVVSNYIVIKRYPANA